MLNRIDVISKGESIFAGLLLILNKQRLERELVRLQRNKERRIARDKQKGLHVDGNAESPISPASPAAAPVQKGTQRKCANCGQVGHIKTNKKYSHSLTIHYETCCSDFVICLSSATCLFENNANKNPSRTGFALC